MTAILEKVIISDALLKLSRITLKHLFSNNKWLVDAYSAYSCNLKEIHKGSDHIAVLNFSLIGHVIS